MNKYRTRIKPALHSALVIALIGGILFEAVNIPLEVMIGMAAAFGLGIFALEMLGVVECFPDIKPHKEGHIAIDI